MDVKGESVKSKKYHISDTIELKRTKLKDNRPLIWQLFHTLSPEIIWK